VIAFSDHQHFFKKILKSTRQNDLKLRNELHLGESLLIYLKEFNSIMHKSVKQILYNTKNSVSNKTVKEQNCSVTFIMEQFWNEGNITFVLEPFLNKNDITFVPERF